MRPLSSWTCGFMVVLQLIASVVFLSAGNAFAGAAMMFSAGAWTALWVLAVMCPAGFVDARDVYDEEGKTR